MSAKDDQPLSELRRTLLKWYRKVRRDLPWRRTRDPYRIWVSEIMLQQTRVEAVIPYYERFLARFPTVDALADAREAEVLTEWSGLGYYRRARLLHEAARSVVRNCGGRFPDDPKAARELPGIGRYTAGAILPIAYDRPEPVLDGNVIRVLTRLFHLPGDPTRGPLSKKLWELAGDIVKGVAPGDVNQGLMELGATVCLPQAAAKCLFCPLQGHCQARKHGSVERLPELPQKKAPVIEHWVVVSATRGGRILMRQRRGETLMDGLWEMPTTALAGRPTRTSLESAVVALLQDLGLTGRVLHKQHEHRQGISGRDVTQHVFEVDIPTGTSSRTRWLYPGQIEQRGITTATRRILKQLQKSSSRVQSSTASSRSSSRSAKR